jgi:hypothetical protein
MFIGKIVNAMDNQRIFPMIFEPLNIMIKVRARINAKQVLSSNLVTLNSASFDTHQPHIVENIFGPLYSA